MSEWSAVPIPESYDCWRIVTPEGRELATAFSKAKADELIERVRAVEGERDRLKTMLDGMVELNERNTADATRIQGAFNAVVNAVLTTKPVDVAALKAEHTAALARAEAAEAVLARMVKPHHPHNGALLDGDNECVYCFQYINLSNPNPVQQHAETCEYRQGWAYLEANGAPDSAGTPSTQEGK